VCCGGYAERMGCAGSEPLPVARAHQWPGAVVKAMGAELQHVAVTGRSPLKISRLAQCGKPQLAGGLNIASSSPQS
jgi:hypothetical protein